MRIDWVSDAGALEALEPAWRDLEEAVTSRTHLSSCDFLIPWYRRYAGPYGGTPLVGFAWRGRDLVGLAPLTLLHGRTGGIPVRRIEFAPSDVPAGEFLIRDGRADVVAVLLASLAGTVHFDVLCLDGFDPASAQLDALGRAARRHRMAVHADEHAFAFVDLRHGYAGYYAGLSSNSRHNLNKKTRKIQAAGFQVDWVFATDAPDRIDRAIERLIAINEASYKLGGRRLADEHRGFLADLVRRLARRGTLALPLLSIGGRDAAFILGVAERGCFYDVAIAYDESCATLSPGTFLMQQTLQRLADAGIHTVVSHGAHEYKRHWATAFVPQRRALLFAPTVRGIAARLAHVRVRPVWDRLRRRIGPADSDGTVRPVGARRRRSREMRAEST
jgi:CelD/BcsL family acetyltransferase involved in cellulose biosynthesis